MSKRLQVYFYSLLMASLLASTASATLGQQDSQIAENEAKVLHVKSQNIVRASSYTVHEIDLDGVLLKEYADSSGMVFAVSWRGLKTPDLSVIFGSYFSEYKIQREKLVPVKGQRSVNLKTSNMVVSSGGHMRNLFGFAYIPSLVPAGLNLQSLN